MSFLKYLIRIFIIIYIYNQVSKWFRQTENDLFLAKKSLIKVSEVLPAISNFGQNSEIIN